MVEKILGANWRTTLVAVLALLGAVLKGAIALLDGDPATVPDYEMIAALLAAAFALFNTRDRNVTSERSGAK